MQWLDGNPRHCHILGSVCVLLSIILIQLHYSGAFPPTAAAAAAAARAKRRRSRKSQSAADASQVAPSLVSATKAVVRQRDGQRAGTRVNREGLAATPSTGEPQEPQEPHEQQQQHDSTDFALFAVYLAQILIPRTDYHLLLESKQASKPTLLADLLATQSVCAVMLQLSGVGCTLCKIVGEDRLAVAGNVALMLPVLVMPYVGLNGLYALAVLRSAILTLAEPATRAYLQQRAPNGFVGEWVGKLARRFLLFGEGLGGGALSASVPTRVCNREIYCLTSFRVVHAF